MPRASVDEIPRRERSFAYFAVITAELLLRSADTVGHATGVDPVRDHRVRHRGRGSGEGQADPQVPIGQVGELGSNPPTSRTSSVEASTPDPPPGTQLFLSTHRRGSRPPVPPRDADPQLLVDHHGADDRPLGLGVDLQRRQLPSKLAGSPEVIVVGEGDPWRVDHGQTGVPRVDTPVGCSFRASAGVDHRSPPRGGGRGVRGAVVDDDHLEVDITLGQHRAAGWRASDRPGCASVSRL